MVLCVVVGCNNRSNSETDKGISFYRVPAVIDRVGKADYELRKLRSEGYLAAINRKNLDLQRLDKYRICERHFISGSPASLYDRTNSDWLPTLNLGYELSESSSSTEDRVARYERAQERELRRTVQQETEALLPTVTANVVYQVVDEELYYVLQLSKLKLPSSISSQERPLFVSALVK